MWRIVSSIVIAFCLWDVLGQMHDQECIDALSGFLPTAGIVKPAYPPDLDGVTLRYFESGCLGTCPSFTLTIRKGSAEFEGHAYVHAKGKRKATVTQDQFERLIRLWFESQVFAMRENYCSWKCPDGSETVVVDLPESSITLTMPGYSKEVYQCFATVNGKPETPKPPEEYFQMSRELLAFAKAHEWL